MSDPLRLAIMKALTGIIETAVADTPSGNLVGRVKRGRLIFGEGDPIPMVSILEPPTLIDALDAPVDSTTRPAEWDVLIQGWSKDDKEFPTDPAYVLQADVGKVLAAEKHRQRGTSPRDLLGLGKRVTEMLIGPPVIRPPDQDSAKACFYMVVRLKMAEDLANPFV